MSSASTSSLIIRKRDGREEHFDLRKVESNLHALSWGLDVGFLSIPEILDSLMNRLPVDPMTSEDFQTFLAEVVSTFSAHHPDYSLLAGRVYTCSIHKRVPKRFTSWVLGIVERTPAVLDDRVVDIVSRVGDRLDAAIMHHRDFQFTYCSLQTFERSYLLRTGREVNERIQFLYMRVALGIHLESVQDVLETYDLLSTRKISLASPVLWNGGLSKRNFASCYIFDPDTLTARDAVHNVASLSALWSADGGVGINAGDVPASRVGPGDQHPGLMPLLGVYDSFASYWSNANRHRSASATVYLPIWHSNVRKFIVCRTNRAVGGHRLRHIFPALWIPHLFMRRLEANAAWSLFDPVTVPSLSGLVGNAFIDVYEESERDGLATATLSARALWDSVCAALRESGCPFILYSDNINERNNQMHLGVIKASNLCTEIVQYSSRMETAVCTLGALCLPQYIGPDGVFNYDELHRVSKILVRTLDKLIDRSDFITNAADTSAERTRALGVGVQGLADVFALAERAFTSPEARAINIRIFETVYHASLQCSTELAEVHGPYPAWQGSPASRGVLQLDMWAGDTTDRYDFDALRERIARYGLRNSMITAQMPTASTAQLLGNSEGIEPYVSNVTQFRLLSGSFNELSRPIVYALCKRGLWTDEVRLAILASRGSVRDIEAVPDDLKAVFRTAFEMDPLDLIDMAVDRSPFIDQSQSFSLFVDQPTPALLTRLQLHAWRAGLKTGAYYVCSKAASDPQPFGVGRMSLKAAQSPAQLSTASTSGVPPFCPCDV